MEIAVLRGRVRLRRSSGEKRRTSNSMASSALAQNLVTCQRMLTASHQLLSLKPSRWDPPCERQMTA